eukprot:Hpha_TRINITY_DN11054_c0_g3::TRINITY_DN11054_c0_g3_i1::g.92996::m.92996
MSDPIHAMEAEAIYVEDNKRSVMADWRLTVVAIIVSLGAGFGIGYAVAPRGGSSGAAAPAPAPVPAHSFLCDVECVKAAATLQHADRLTELGNLKYNIDVVFEAEEIRGEFCGVKHTFPAFRARLDPSAPVKLTTAQTRVDPSVVFECAAGKTYHLILNDALGGAFQAVNAYTHWVRLNIPCDGATGLADFASGEDMPQGTTEQPGWFSGKGYLFPAFPYNSWHHFNFYVYETDAPIDADGLAWFATEFPKHNQLGQGSYNLSQVTSELLNFTAAPVARTWMDVTTSYYSGVRMGALAEKIPAMKNMDFYKLICPCNDPDNAQGMDTEYVAKCKL